MAVIKGKKLTLDDVKKAQQARDEKLKKYVEFWSNKVKLLKPQEGDILIIPAEANIEHKLLAVAIKETRIKYALIVPQGKLELMHPDELKRFVQNYIKQNPDIMVGVDLGTTSPRSAIGGESSSKG